jgi:cell division protein FtsQ
VAEGDVSEPAPAPPRSGQAGFSRFRAVLGLVVIAGLSASSWLFKDWEPRLLPIRVIEVKGELHHHSSQLLQQTLSARLHGGILTVDLLDLKAAAEDLSWVGRASLRRVWPDRLQVQVEEHRPLARWNNDCLVTAAGIVFQQGGGTVPAGLPQLHAEDQRAVEVVTAYQKWRGALQQIGHVIAVLTVDSRGDWQLELVKGIRLRLGTEAIEERLARFIASAPQLEAAGQPLKVDLRYRNGFAVTWAPNVEPAVPAVNTDRQQRSGNRG